MMLADYQHAVVIPDGFRVAIGTALAAKNGTVAGADAAAQAAWDWLQEHSPPQLRLNTLPDQA